MMDTRRKSLFLLMRKAYPGGKVDSQLNLARTLTQERVEVYLSTFSEVVEKKVKKKPNLGKVIA